MAARFALVTGGNRGIGLDVSKRFLKSGGRVLLASRNLKDGQAAAQTLEAEIGGVSNRVTPVELDVSKEASIQKLVALIQAEYPGQINVLVNNAGILEPGWNQELFDRTLATNAWGPMLLIDGLIPLLAPGANVVNVSSGLGGYKLLKGKYAEDVPTAKSIDELKALAFDPESEQGVGSTESWPTYNLSKAVLNRCTQLLAVSPELTSRSLKVNAVCPGWCRTRMGGQNAFRSAEQGGESVFLATNVQDTGKFFRDGQEVAW